MKTALPFSIRIQIHSAPDQWQNLMGQRDILYRILLLCPWRRRKWMMYMPCLIRRKFIPCMRSWAEFRHWKKSSSAWQATEGALAAVISAPWLFIREEFFRPEVKSPWSKKLPEWQMILSSRVIFTMWVVPQQISDNHLVRNSSRKGSARISSACFPRHAKTWL